MREELFKNKSICFHDGCEEKYKTKLIEDDEKLMMAGMVN